MPRSASGETERPLLLFNYDPTRSGEVPRGHLEGFTGTLPTECYAGYDAVAREQGLQRLCCFAHARRGFTDTLKSLSLNPARLPPNHVLTWLPQGDGVERLLPYNLDPIRLTG